MTETNPGRLSSLGPIMQMGFVPKHFDEALHHWTTTMGVGPFYYIEHAPLCDIRYRGQPSNVDMSVALAYWGDMQIELIRQHDDTPSTYQDWLQQGREGLHHLCISVADMKAAHRTLLSLGATPVQEMRMEGVAEAAYFELPGPGPIIEVAQLAPKFQNLFAYIRSAAQHWDGTDPLRAVPPEAEWHRIGES